MGFGFSHEGRRNFGFERLESRRMMAGDVTVLVRNGDLIIRGDDLDNDIMIQAGDNPNEFEIIGLGSTAVNGAVGIPQFFVGVTDDFEINMRDGIDVVTMIDNFNFPGSESFIVPDVMRLNTGAGEDTVSITNVTVGTEAFINTLSEDDSVTINNLTAGQTLVIRTDGGSDDISLNTIAVTLGDLDIRTGDSADLGLLFDVNVGGNTLVHLGEGDDIFDIAVANLTGDFNAVGGLGNDDITTAFVNIGGSLDIATNQGLDHVGFFGDTNILGSARVAMGEGNDNFEAADLVVNIDFLLATGAGEDIVVANGASESFAWDIGGNLTIQTGAENDQVQLLLVHVGGDTRVQVAGGDDQVALNDSIFDGLVEIEMGLGEDLLEILLSTFNDELYCNGGGGTDTFLTDMPTTEYEAERFENLI